MQHRGSASYNIPERDVESWLSLQTPGTLWQTNPANKYGRQPRLNVERDGEDGSAQYKFPLRGGRFEATEPAADLFPTPDLPSCNSDGRAKEGEISWPPYEARTVAAVWCYIIVKSHLMYFDMNPNSRVREQSVNKYVVHSFFTDRSTKYSSLVAKFLVHTGSKKDPKKLGPDYTRVTTTYVRGKAKRTSSCLLDEVYDFLSDNLWPHGIATRHADDPRKRAKTFSDFAATAKESYFVTTDEDEGGRRTLLHLVKPSPGHEQQGVRHTNFGPRIVPPQADIDHVIAWVRTRESRGQNLDFRWFAHSFIPQLRHTHKFASRVLL